jgi:hypothetical protein
MFLLLSLSTALAQNTHCTATDDSGLVYETGRHGGGAQPGVGVEVARETWWLGDIELAMYSNRYLSPAVTRGALTVTWHTEDQQPVEVQEPVQADVAVPIGPPTRWASWSYTTHVTVSTTEGAPLAPGQPAVLERVPMTCTVSNPPPRP